MSLLKSSLFVPPFELIFLIVLLNYVLPLILPLLMGFFLGKKMKTKHVAAASVVLWLTFLSIILFAAPWGSHWIFTPVGGFTFSLTIYLGIIICLGIETGFLTGYLKHKQKVKNIRV